MLLFFTSSKNGIVPDVPVSIRLDPGECFFSQGFSRTEFATTKSANVTRDNELTSQEEFPLRARGQAPAQTCVVLTPRTVKKTVEAAQGL